MRLYLHVQALLTAAHVSCHFDIIPFGTVLKSLCLVVNSFGKQFIQGADNL